MTTTLPTPPQGVSRRSFVAGALALGAAAAATFEAIDLANAGSARAAGTTTAWILNPDWGYPRGARGRTSCLCNACRHHAENKVYATEADANDASLRAHRGCLCVPQQISMDSDAYHRVFGGGAPVVDRRDPRTQAALADQPTPPAGNPPVNNPVSNPPVTNPPVTNPPVTNPPVTKHPVTKQPITKHPVTKHPVTKQPVTKHPVGTRPVTTPPHRHHPTAKPPADRHPATRPPATGISPISTTRGGHRPVGSRHHTQSQPVQGIARGTAPRRAASTTHRVATTRAGNGTQRITAQRVAASSPAAENIEWQPFGLMAAAAATAVGALIWFRRRGEDEDAAATDPNETQV